MTMFFFLLPLCFLPASKYIWGLFIVMIIAALTFPGYMGQYMALSSAAAIEDLSKPDITDIKVTKAHDWASPNSCVVLFLLLRCFFLF